MTPAQPSVAVDMCRRGEYTEAVEEIAAQAELSAMVRLLERKAWMSMYRPNSFRMSSSRKFSLFGLLEMPFSISRLGELWLPKFFFVRTKLSGFESQERVVFLDHEHRPLCEWQRRSEVQSYTPINKLNIF